MSAFNMPLDYHPAYGIPSLHFFSLFFGSHPTTVPPALWATKWIHRWTKILRKSWIGSRLRVVGRDEKWSLQQKQSLQMLGSIPVPWTADWHNLPATIPLSQLTLT